MGVKRERNEGVQKGLPSDIVMHDMNSLVRFETYIAVHPLHLFCMETICVSGTLSKVLQNVKFRRADVLSVSDPN